MLELLCMVHPLFTVEKNPLLRSVINRKSSGQTSCLFSGPMLTAGWTLGVQKRVRAASGPTKSPFTSDPEAGELRSAAMLPVDTWCPQVMGTKDRFLLTCSSHAEPSFGLLTANCPHILPVVTGHDPTVQYYSPGSDPRTLSRVSLTAGACAYACVLVCVCGCFSVCVWACVCVSVPACLCGSENISVWCVCGFVHACASVCVCAPICWFSAVLSRLICHGWTRNCRFECVSQQASHKTAPHHKDPFIGTLEFPLWPLLVPKL